MRTADSEITYSPHRIQSSACDMDEGCCFCDAPHYKRCTLCGHLVCLQHVGPHGHNCSAPRPAEDKEQSK